MILKIKSIHKYKVTNQKTKHLRGLKAPKALKLNNLAMLIIISPFFILIFVTTLNMR